MCNNSDLSKIKNRSFGLELENKQFYFYINEEFKKGQEVEFGSVGGGGRYDNLISRFTNPTNITQLNGLVAIPMRGLSIFL